MSFFVDTCASDDHVKHNNFLMVQTKLFYNIKVFTAEFYKLWLSQQNGHNCEEVITKGIVS